VTVYLGRWQDTLPGTYDPATAVVVTDPPFGLAGKGAGIAGDRHQVDRGFIDDRPWAEHVVAVLRDLPAARHVIRGPAPAVIRRDHPQPRRLCIEVATGFRRTMFRPDVVDHAWTGWGVYGSLRIERRGKGMPRDVVLVDSARDPDTPVARGDARHRGQTPIDAARWAVATWVPVGWTVIDPFAGLGTIGRAALEFGCGYIGAEIDPGWHAVAETALTATPLRLAL